MLDARMDVGGAGRYCQELPQALLHVGDEPRIDVVRHRHDPVGSVLTMPFSPWGRLHVDRIARSRGADLIHGLHFELPSSWSGLSCVTVQDLIPLDFPASMPSPIRRRVFRAAVMTALAQADTVIVPSEMTAASVHKRSGAGAKTRVIPLWASSVFAPLTEPELAEARGRFANGAPYVATIYHPKPHKNLGVLASAGVALSEKSATKIVACGSLEVPDGLHGIGRLSEPDLRLFMGGAELFALPSLVEGFGLPAIEAMACGTPVVCGPGIGALPWVEAGAIVVDVTDPSAIANTLLRWLADPALAELSSNVPSVAAKLSRRSCAEQTMEVYRELLA